MKRLAYKIYFVFFGCICLLIIFLGIFGVHCFSNNKKLEEAAKNSSKVMIPIFYNPDLCYCPNKSCDSVIQKITNENKIDLFYTAGAHTATVCESKFFDLKSGERYKIKFKSTVSSTSSDPTPLVLSIHMIDEKAGSAVIQNTQYVQFPNSTDSHEVKFSVPKNVTKAKLYIQTKLFGSISLEDVELENVIVSDDEIILKNLEEFTGKADYNSSSMGVFWDYNLNGLTIKAQSNLLSPSVVLNPENWTLDKKEYSVNNLLELVNENSIKITPLESNKATPLTLKKEINLIKNTDYTLSFSYKCHCGDKPFHVLLENAQGEVLMNETVHCTFLQEEGNALNRKGNGWIQKKVYLPSYKRTIDDHKAFLKIITYAGKNPFYFKAFNLEMSSSSLAEVQEENPYLISSIYYIGENKNVFFEWKGEETSLNSLDFYIRTGVTPAYTKETWSTWKKVENKNNIPLLAPGFPLYVQWKCILSSKNSHNNPILRSIILRPLQKKMENVNQLMLVSIENGHVSEFSNRFLKKLEKYKKNNYGKKYKEVHGYKELENISYNHTKNYMDYSQKEMALLDFVIKNLNKGGYASKTTLDKINYFEKNKSEGFIPYVYYDVIKDHGGGTCSYNSHVLMNLCHLIDIPARIIGLTSLDGRGHSVVEIWSDKYQKWYMADPTYGGIFSSAGVPLSVFELRKLSRTDLYNTIEIVTQENWGIPILSFKNAYAFPSDATQAKLFDLCRDMFGYWYYDTAYEFMKDPYYESIKTSKEEIDYPLNQVEMSIEYFSDEMIKVHLTNNAYNFKHYEIQENALSPHVFTGDIYVWKLKRGINLIKIRSVSKKGKKGKIFSATIEK